MSRVANPASRESIFAKDLRTVRQCLNGVVNHDQHVARVLDPLMEVFFHQIKLTISFNTGWEQHRNIFLEIQAHNPVGARQAVRRLMKVTHVDSRTALKSLGQASSHAVPVSLPSR